MVRAVILDPARARIIDAVSELQLPECWIAGGFVRNAVWDARFGNERATPINDVDVIYFKPLDTYGIDRDALLELIAADKPNPVWEEEEEAREKLARAVPGYEFEVKNQARMHISSRRIVKHEPYASIEDAVAGWTETATASGIRRLATGEYEVFAPFGLHDLEEGIVRPTQEIYITHAKKRALEKGWFTLWPKVRFEPYDEIHTRRR